jgi:hypothetical protein
MKPFKGTPYGSEASKIYGVFRVEDSSLVRRLAVMNSVHKRHDYSIPDGLTHYIFTFRVTEQIARDEQHGRYGLPSLTPPGPRVYPSEVAQLAC